MHERFDPLTYRGAWQSILTNAGIPEAHLSGSHTSCPMCGGVDRFIFDDQNGTGSWFCNQCGGKNGSGGAGDGMALLMKFRRWTFQQALNFIRGTKEAPPTFQIHSVAPPKDRKEQPEVLEALKQAFDSACLLTPETASAKYLRQTRKLDLVDFPSDLRHADNHDYWHQGKRIGSFPCLLAAVRNLAGDLISVHRMYLSERGEKLNTRSASGEPLNARKLWQSWKPKATVGAAIQLFPAGDTLGLSEGLETALACHTMFKIPIWACISKDGLRAVEIPSTVRHVHIFADNDDSGVGRRAANELAGRLSNQSIQIKIYEPKKVNTDFADLVAGVRP